ncbi:transcription antitermination factor NusB [Patescibacteria group bacterium]|nr:transcription antitermination factor NusB [Patescibacteria group bacterium]
MASNRHLARLIAIQTLYEWGFISERFPSEEKVDEKTKVEEILERNYQEFKKSLNNKDFLADLVWGTLNNRINIDKIVAPAAPEWPIDQIALVDLTVLRLAIYELLFKREVPPKVAINEAVELSKSLGGPNSSKFINGVLGTVYRASEIYNPEDDVKSVGQKDKGDRGEDKK